MRAHSGSGPSAHQQMRSFHPSSNSRPSPKPDGGPGPFGQLGGRFAGEAGGNPFTGPCGSAYTPQKRCGQGLRGGRASVHAGPPGIVSKRECVYGQFWDSIRMSMLPKTTATTTLGVACQRADKNENNISCAAHTFAHLLPPRVPEGTFRGTTQGSSTP